MNTSLSDVYQGRPTTHEREAVNMTAVDICLWVTHIEKLLRFREKGSGLPIYPPTKVIVIDRKHFIKY